MGYQPIEELLPQANGSIYLLVKMASNRALELSEGKPCLIENPTTDKVTTTALEEIREGMVVSKEAADGFSEGKRVLTPEEDKADPQEEEEEQEQEAEVEA